MNVLLGSMFTEARKEKAPENTGTTSVSVQRALIPPDRHITTSFQTLAEESPGQNTLTKQRSVLWYGLKTLVKS